MGITNIQTKNQKSKSQLTNQEKKKENFDRCDTEEPIQSLKKERFEGQCLQDAERHSNRYLPLFIPVLVEWTVS